MTPDYTAKDLVAALRACGLGPGMAVFSHSNVGYFGRPEGAASGAAVCRLIFDAIFEVLGESGTLVVPTFTYSFGSTQAEKRFDRETTPSVCGMFTEFVRTRGDARRSADPMFSVAAVGRLAHEFTKDPDPECFGEASFWRRFLDADGVFCNLNFDAGSTFVHFVERRLGVPYRENRAFRGEIVEHGVVRPAEAVFFCRDLSERGTGARFERFDALAREAGLVRSAPVGRGAVVVITAADTARLIADTLPREPWFLTDRGAGAVAARG